MPFTTLQTQILKLLAANRSPESYIAGGSLINRSADSPRISRDVDIFNDRVELVHETWKNDKAALENAGFVCEVQKLLTTFIRAKISLADQATEIDWALDSAFRFLPIVQDDALGWRLSATDSAVNKAIAFADRDEPRDLVDILWLDRQGFRLGALLWALPGKNPGYTPEFALEIIRRRAVVPQDRELTLRKEAQGFSPVEIQRQWRALLEQAEREIVAALDAGLDIGYVFFPLTQKEVPADAIPAWGDVLFNNPRQFIAHRATCGGIWPTIHESGTHGTGH